MYKNNKIFFKVYDYFLKDNAYKFSDLIYDYTDILNNRAEYIDIYGLYPAKSLKDKIKISDFGFFGVRYQGESFEEYIKKVQNSDMFKKYYIENTDKIIKTADKIKRKNLNIDKIDFFIKDNQMSVFYENNYKSFVKHIPFDKNDKFYFNNLEELLSKTVKGVSKNNYNYKNYLLDVFIKEENNKLIVSDFLNKRQIKLDIDDYLILNNTLFYQTDLTDKTFMLNLENFRKKNYELKEVLNTKIILPFNNLVLSDIKEAGYKNFDFFRYKDIYFSKQGEFFEIKDDVFIKDKKNDLIIFNKDGKDCIYNLKNKNIITKGNFFTTDNLIIENTDYNNIVIYDKNFIPLTDKFNLSFDLEEKNTVFGHCKLNINEIDINKIERFFKDGLFNDFLKENFKYINSNDLKSVEIKTLDEVEINNNNISNKKIRR